MIKLILNTSRIATAFSQMLQKTGTWYMPVLLTASQATEIDMNPNKNYDKNAYI